MVASVYLKLFRYNKHWKSFCKYVYCDINYVGSVRYPTSLWTFQGIYGKAVPGRERLGCYQTGEATLSFTIFFLLKNNISFIYFFVQERKIQYKNADANRRASRTGKIKVRGKSSN